MPKELIKDSENKSITIKYLNIFIQTIRYLLFIFFMLLGVVLSTENLIAGSIIIFSAIILLPFVTKFAKSKLIKKNTALFISSLSLILFFTGAVIYADNIPQETKNRLESERIAKVEEKRLIKEDKLRQYELEKQKEIEEEEREKEEQELKISEEQKSKEELEKKKNDEAGELSKNENQTIEVSETSIESFEKRIRNLEDHHFIKDSELKNCMTLEIDLYKVYCHLTELEIKNIWNADKKYLKSDGSYTNIDEYFLYLDKLNERNKGTIQTAYGLNDEELGVMIFVALENNWKNYGDTIDYINNKP